MRRRDLRLGALASPSKTDRFTDVTSHVFGGTPSFSGPTGEGIPYWRSALDVACGTDVFGSQGLPLGIPITMGAMRSTSASRAADPIVADKVRADGIEDLTERAGVGIL